MIPIPIPPRNVHLVRGDDGTTVPLEVAYLGVEDSTHIWATVTSVVLRHGDVLQADYLPARTALRISTDDTR